MKQKEPGSKFVDLDNVKLYAGTGPGPFRMNDLCTIDDHSISVIDIFKALGFNYFEIHMPLKHDVDDFKAVAELEETAALPQRIPVKPPANAFSLLMAGSAANICSILKGHNSPKNNLQRLFNFCCDYINGLGKTFPSHLVRSGGQVFSVASSLTKLIWEIDNNMQYFVDLAGGQNCTCVPSFVYSLGQGTNADSLSNRTLWDDYTTKKHAKKHLQSAKLMDLSVELNEILFMGCFNKSLWASFKADIRQCSLALERVSEKLNKKSELM